eukprot:CAMPEP_0119016162 /NCGR_PEP_ID=MMETSP1176-20130426/11847_1 /TAXON_ID=265551 /ORGANISM="Synedropsis recta cf, Strain CCMP1620" /LENGTH=109 /DNA_ID=CAMNT_0006969495 /DNA_START=188 /DNA_END=514 /DNA_ORIENTATION=-
MTVISRRGTTSDGSDGYDSAVRFLRDMYRKGSLRTGGLDVVMEDCEQDDSVSSTRSLSSRRVRKAQTCVCLSSLNDEGGEISLIRDVGEEKKQSMQSESSVSEEESSAW